jgi:FkbM family methyltransferase
MALDFGAHAGAITRQTIPEMERIKAYSKVHFVCVEPNDREFANLHFNLLSFNNCTLVNLGIHPIHQKINLTPDWINSGNSTTLNHTILRFRKMKMATKRAVSLENLLEMFEPHLPIIFKSDLEGLDIAILQNLDLDN